jgi:hypothetical protein
MSELRHWHGTPSELKEPEACCKAAFDQFHDRTLDEAVHAERVRVINSALDVIENYGVGIASVLTGEAAGVAAKVTAHAIEAIGKSGCICPRIDTTTFGGLPSWALGRDARCGMHDSSRTVTP